MNAKADVVEKDYLGWAVKNGFEVIDVNVPKIEPISEVLSILSDISMCI
jgi:hypothetical protein